MIWFFEREHSRLHYEIRCQPDGHEYELIITHPDGRQEIEQFRDPTAILERSLQLQNTLLTAGWEPPTIRPSRGRPEHRT
jgi:hypothetical protein